MPQMVIENGKHPTRVEPEKIIFETKIRLHLFMLINKKTKKKRFFFKCHKLLTNKASSRKKLKHIFEHSFQTYLLTFLWQNSACFSRQRQIIHISSTMNFSQLRIPELCHQNESKV